MDQMEAETYVGAFRSLFLHLLRNDTEVRNEARITQTISWVGVGAEGTTKLAAWTEWQMTDPYGELNIIDGPCNLKHRKTTILRI